ncbi:MAG: D-alanine--D-alanine ligase family protein [Chloroflexota bacterium]|nr:D-alanine--D-alanine ligase [Dehalococcoidia bacterium]MDW8252895.1 D-alanine--D-alanine ligase family protein [Chloroflexota bacterium]
MAKLRVGVLFGSRSVEHDVSIVTARQVMAALDRAKYDVVPIYITEEGRWLVGEALATAPLADFKRRAPTLPGVVEATLLPDPQRRALAAAGGKGFLGLGRAALPPLDVAFPCVHGTNGEDGTLQGLFELANLPYVGAGVTGAALGMDKIVMKAVFRDAGIPVVESRWFTRSEWLREKEGVLDRLEAALPYPMYVKPANLGSSVGISRADDRNGLEYAIEVALRYDRRILVEQGLTDIVEVNCAVLGNDTPEPSVCEQPARWQDLLSFEDKYLAGGKAKGMSGARRQIPAPIGDALTREVQRLAVAAFKAIDCAGIARVDTMVRLADGRVWVNEINTMPGSLAFYLWEPLGISFTALCDRLIALAFERHRERQERLTHYDNALLSHAGGQKVSGRI